jgi:hypothetical protein
MLRDASSHLWPLSLQPDGISGHAQRPPGTLRKCLLSSRSRVRVAVGAQVRGLESHRTAWLGAKLLRSRHIRDECDSGRNLVQLPSGSLLFSYSDHRGAVLEIKIWPASISIIPRAASLCPGVGKVSPQVTKVNISSLTGLIVKIQTWTYPAAAARSYSDMCSHE